MSDSKFFARGKVDALRVELQSAGDRKDKGFVKTKGVLKKVVANMTMGIDMSPLFSEVVACMNIQALDIKKMVYLYLVNYARSKPDMMKHAMEGFLSDSNDRNPLIRALAIRTMSYIQVPTVMSALVDPLRHALKDSDPYVRKTAAICVGKLFMIDKRLVDKEGFMNDLRDLLADANPTVIANAVAALVEIGERSDSIQLRLNASISSKLVSAMGECSEWGQTYILEALMYFTPQESEDAEILAERIAIRLQHANSAVVLTTIKVILHLMNYIQDENRIEGLCRKLSPPLVTLLSSGYEVQYVALRNILLIIQRRPTVLQNDVKVFFCKYNDPIYVKLSKLEIIYRLVDRHNYPQVLAELQEYATEVDVDFVRKAVRAIGRLAIKINSAADKCIGVLLELVSTRISYVVQEAVVVIKDVFRKYPNQYEGIIATLCEHLEAFDTPEAKAAMIWIIGQYADRIENSDELLEDFLNSFLDESVEVQLALLTATVKLFIKRPTAGQELVPKVLKWATEEVDNPDLRDRGYIYWRLLSTDPVAAKDIVLSEKPSINTEAEAMERSVLDRLLLNTGSLASVYHQLPETFIRGAVAKRLHDSSAMNAAARSSMKAADPAPIPQSSALRQRRGDDDAPLLSVSTATNGTRPPLPPKRTDTTASLSAYNAMGTFASRGNDLLGDLEEDRSPVYASHANRDAHDPYAGLDGAFGSASLDDDEEDGEQHILARSSRGKRGNDDDDY